MKAGEWVRLGLAGVAVVAGLAVLPQVGRAEDRVTLGWGRMFSNDGLGDARDRWRTGAYTVSRVRGRDWDGNLPGFGEILEFRARAEILAPEDLVSPDPGDRRYAGVLTFGLHTHFSHAGLDSSLGLELAVTGPQTGLGDVQSYIHDHLGLPQPQVLDDQIGNAVHLGALAEVGRSLSFGPARLRPFAEAQVGIETMVRLGFDLDLGPRTQGALMLRDSTTGQRYRGIDGDMVPGWSLSLGGDIAHVFDSALLPEGGAAERTETRSRLRAGLAWQGARGASVFYGVTWLGKEFAGQSEGQAVGSLSLNLNF